MVSLFPAQLDEFISQPSDGEKEKKLDPDMNQVGQPLAQRGKPGQKRKKDREKKDTQDHHEE